jgi:hypothetical protein
MIGRLRVAADRQIEAVEHNNHWYGRLRIARLIEEPTELEAAEIA